MLSCKSVLSCRGVATLRRKSLQSQCTTQTLLSRRLMSSAHGGEALSDEERRYLAQELPSVGAVEAAEAVTDDAAFGRPEMSRNVPGDSFGTMRNRVIFYYPVPRQPEFGPLGRLMPADAHPTHCVRPDILRSLCGRYGVSAKEALSVMLEARCDVNVVIQALQSRSAAPRRREFGLVCLEAYAPETFCLVSYCLPSFAATRDDRVLDALHELTLSAAELPLDTPRNELAQRFIHEWTTEDGVPCQRLLEELDVSVREIVLLPYGEYAVQGFHVLHPVKPDTPNIGTAAAACCLDLRTGIHNRFRFHVERMADSLSEHVVQEGVHYGQPVHVLRQPYWFRPEYSVEEYIRFKESLLQPSAATFEMRYAAVFAAPFQLPGYRNIVEMEKLRVAQYKFEKHYEDFTASTKPLTSDGSALQTMAFVEGGAMTPGATLHQQTNDKESVKHAMETRTGGFRQLMRQTMLVHGDRVFDRFYRNNFF